MPPTAAAATIAPMGSPQRSAEPTRSPSPACSRSPSRFDCVCFGRAADSAIEIFQLFVELLIVLVEAAGRGLAGDCVQVAPPPPAANDGKQKAEPAEGENARHDIDRA